jgi:hypothetical protein
MTNADRVESAKGACDYFTEGDDTATSVIDLLTNLRHLCAAEGVDFEARARMALTHFEAEQGND